jgi:hypothetical protein
MSTEYVPWYEQLRDPRWQKLRLEVMQRDDFQCQQCGHKDKPLNVHHLRYIRGYKAWDYDPIELRCLCEDCHAGWHELKDAMEAEVASMECRLSLEHALSYMIGVRYLDPRLIDVPFPPLLARTDGKDFGLADALSVGFEEVREAFQKHGDATTVRLVRKEAGR